MMGFIANRLRTLFWTVFYHTLGRYFFASLGTGARFQGWVELPQRGRVHIGKNAHVCRGVELCVLEDADLILDEGVFLGPGVVISAHRRVYLGRHVQVAESVSIHDNNHRRDDPFRPMGQQGFEIEPIEIGDNSWLGARTIVVKGGGLGRRCVLGAGAVLTRKFPDGITLIGAPARPSLSLAEKQSGAA